jgi:signal peptidase I
MQEGPRAVPEGGRAVPRRSWVVVVLTVLLPVLFLLMAFLVNPQNVRLFQNLIRAYQIPNTSMEPTLLAGDFILARILHHAPGRGQLVIFRRVNGSWVKRVVGTPSDTLTMRAGVLTVNGHEVSEPYAVHEQGLGVFDKEFLWQRGFLTATVDASAYHPTSTFWGPIVVPAANYFVLGDNRAQSLDSRYFGFVAADSIAEEPTVIYFSLDHEKHSVRLSRMGTRLNPP